MLKFSAIRLVIFLSMLAPASYGQDRWIQGKVYRPNGQPLEVSVRVEIKGPRASSQTVDTHNGLFGFRADVLGEYTVIVDAGEEFEVATDRVLVDENLLRANSASDGHSTWVNIYLKVNDRTVVHQTTTTLDAKLANIPKKALDHYGKGLKLAAGNKFNEAAAELQKAVKAHQGFYQALTELGKVYFKLGRFDDAVAAFRSSLAASPDSFAGRLHLGMALLNLKKFAEAAPEFTAAALLDQTMVSPHYYLGVARYEIGDIDNAVSAFEKARKLNGDKPYPMLHKYLASLYLKKAKWAHAVDELEKYLAQSPDAPDTEKIRATLAEARAKIK